MTPEAVWTWFTSLSTHWKVVLCLFGLISVMEFGVGRAFPRSGVYRGWQRGVEGVASVWTALILSIVYLLGVGPVALGMRARGSDLLDSSLASEPSFWRQHEPNPLGPETAARHQF